MSDLLAQKLKFAKRELTALKTAYARGLGNLKVYTREYTIPSAGHRDYTYTIILTLNFDTDFAPYPYVYLLPTLPDVGLRFNVEAEGFEYSDGGRKAIFHIFYNYQNDALDKFTVISTAPVSSMSYEWREYV